VFSVGQAYERFMGRWSRQLAPLLVQFAGIADAHDVLDVGTGTGSLTGAVATAAPSSLVIGIDRSESYVAVARAQREGPRVHFAIGDAHDLPFHDHSFDVAISLLILNFIPDPNTALKEQVRVTRPGGTVTAAVWDYGGHMEMLRLFWDDVVALDPDADANDERHMPLCRRGELGALWRAHGLLTVTETPLTIDTRFSSFDDYWSPFLAQQGPAGAHIATLPAAKVERLRGNLRQRLLGSAADRPITLQARAWAVKGTVPERTMPRRGAA
jgi:SAM-dependent methyltransferase